MMASDLFKCSKSSKLECFTISQRQSARVKSLALSLLLAPGLMVLPLTPACLSSQAVAATADSSGSSAANDMAASYKRLDDFEEVIYGEPRKYLTMDARLKELEVKLFGKGQSGTPDTRLTAIARAISYGAAQAPGSVNDLTPTLDTVSSATKTKRDNSLPDYEVDSSGALEDAMQLYSDGKIAEAEAAFHGIIVRDPKSADAYYNLAVIQESRGDIAGALSNYRQAYKLKPTEADYAGAVQAIEAKLGPVYGTTAVASASAKPTSSASSSPPASPASTPTVSSVDGAGKNVSAADKKLVSQAAVNFKAKQYDQAIDKLKMVANHNPRDADVQYAIAQAYKAKGDMVGAQSYMVRAADLAPSNTSYQRALADMRGTAASGSAAPVVGAAPSTPASGNIQPFANSQAPGAAKPGEIFSGRATANAPSDKNKRIKRAITYGIAGAATSVLASTLLTSKNARGGKYNISRMRNAAVTGAALGGLMGYMLGK
ncbi:MAG: tetratricopeptide repeat protein [Candidatus Obscuribacter sp.]|nr:tetratricopeptide repeat protein [Candidatus Obscuribacter sp.]